MRRKRRSRKLSRSQSAIPEHVVFGSYVLLWISRTRVQSLRRRPACGCCSGARRRRRARCLRVFLEYHQSSYLAWPSGSPTNRPAQANGERAVDRRADQARHRRAAVVDGARRGGSDFRRRISDSMEEIMAAYADEHVMRDDETLSDLLDKFKAQNAETLRILDSADLDTPVPVPQECRGFRRTSITGRCAGSSTTSSMSWPAIPATPTSFANPSTARLCTNWSPASKAGKRPIGSSPGSLPGCNCLSPSARLLTMLLAFCVHQACARRLIHTQSQLVSQGSSRSLHD